jgi:hypothetical protein
MRFAGQAFQQKMPAAVLLKLNFLDKRLLDKMTEFKGFKGFPEMNMVLSSLHKTESAL